jgi:hypothetical protein
VNIKSTVLCTVLFLFFIIPAQAAEQGFTVYGQVFDTDNTPVNGVTVSLSISLGTIHDVTKTANGTLVNGYYYLDLANLPGGVPSAGTLMTLTATYNGKSASKVVPRNATEPQQVDLYLSTSSTATSIPTVSATTSTGGGGGGETTSGSSTATPIPTVSATTSTGGGGAVEVTIPPTETTTQTPAATTKSPGFDVALVVAVLLTLYVLRRKKG